MKRIMLTMSILALLWGGPARGGLVLVGGPNQGSFTNNFGFGSNGVGSAGNPTASYWVGGVDNASNLGSAPVSFLFVFGASGTISTYYDSTVGPYEDVDDAQIAVLNNSGKTLTSMVLHGPAGFAGFDGDGIGATWGGLGSTATGIGAPSNGSDGSNGLYGGPQTYFSYVPGGPSIIDDDFVTTIYANFVGGLPTGSTTYFSLEGPPNALTGIGTSVPEPASLTLLGMGVVGLIGYGWRRRKQAA